VPTIAIYTHQEMINMLTASRVIAQDVRRFLLFLDNQAYIIVPRGAKERIQQLYSGIRVLEYNDNVLDVLKGIVKATDRYVLVFGILTLDNTATIMQLNQCKGAVNMQDVRYLIPKVVGFASVGEQVNVRQWAKWVYVSGEYLQQVLEESDDIMSLISHFGISL